MDDRPGRRSVAAPAMAAPIALGLLLATFAQLLAAWWFPQNVLLRTVFADITPIEVVVAGGALLLVAGRTWRLMQRDDVPWLLLFGAYLSWIPIAALLRGAGADLKPALVYLLFAGSTAAVAFAAVRASPRVTPRRLVAFLGIVLILAVAGAALERVTYPVSGSTDPLADFWRLFRPANVSQHPRLGQLGPPPLHFRLGGENAIRATGFFFHTNYMAFFGILLAPLVTAVTLRGWHAGDRRLVAAGSMGIVLASLLTYWTYSRAGLLGLVGAVGATVVIDVAWRLRIRTRSLRRDLMPGALTAALLVLTLGATVLADDLGARRLAATDFPDPIISDEPFEPGVEGSASRSAQIRVRLQTVALEQIADSPRSLIVGPGMTSFDLAVHDPASPDLIPDAAKINDPNSLWLTAGLAGGLPAILLLLAVLGVAWLRLIRAFRDARSVWHGAALLWLTAWIPVWALVQFVGTNPLALAEAVILGTLLGLAAGLSGRRPPVLTLSRPTSSSR
ncbi:MAG: hypothetical protein H0W00_00685 [Chloroflexi bacterium]|nr:hypothetical protein [Chloroflexota bacterium]